MLGRVAVLAVEGTPDVIGQRQLGTVRNTLNTGSNRPGVITDASVTGNTKSAWTELTASLAVPASAMVVGYMFERAGPTDALFDIGVSTDGSTWFPVVENLLIATATGWQNESLGLFVPVRLPRGQHIGVRYQCSNVTSEIASAQLTIIGDSSEGDGDGGFAGLESMGHNLADSGGVQIDPGGTITTKGTAATIITSTTKAYKGLYLGVGNQQNDARSGASWLIDVGIDVSGTIEWILQDLSVRSSASRVPLPRMIGPFWHPVPAGSKIVARCQCSINTAGDRLLDAIVYGLA